MGIHRGPNPVNDGLVFGCDTGYGIADNITATRFYPGEPTTNSVSLEDFIDTSNWTGSGWSGALSVSTDYPNTLELTATNGWRTYCIDTGITSGGTVTVSYEYKAKSIENTSSFVLNLNGTHLGSYTNGLGNGTNADIKSGEWIRVTKSWTANSDDKFAIGVRGADGYGLSDTIYVRNLQIELNGHATPYTATTRSSTASLIDLKRTTNIDVSNVSFDSTGQPTFDGSNDYITIPGSSGITSDAKTVEIMFKMNGSYPNFSPLAIYANGSSSTNRIWLGLQNSKFRMHGWGTDDPEGTTTISADEWYVCTFSYDKSTQAMKVYTNGVLETSTTNTQGGVTASSSLNWYLGTVPGGWQSVTYSDVDIPIFKLYNRILSDSEVKQNYNAYKNRFDI